MDRYGVAVIGAGIVGLAIAYRLGKRFPDRPVLVLEKETTVAHHQSGRNSGVIHSGLYYKPGSVKAGTCRLGRRQLIEFCEAHHIPHRIGGKLIIAGTRREVEELEPLYRRGLANGVSCALLGASEIDSVEPSARGLGGIHVRDTGVVDFRKVAERLAQRIAARSGKVVTGAAVTGVRPESKSVTVQTTAGDFTALGVIACAGLHADRVARMCGATPGVSILPVRGEYYRVREELEHRIRSMIYPVPNPDYPFLGPHLTRRSDGSLEAGPNAVLQWSRDGTGFNIGEAFGQLATPGFLAMAARHAKRGFGESWRARSKRAFAGALKKMVPEITPADLRERRTGVRAQALGPDGSFIDDFLFLDQPRIVPVLNAPSPGATACLAIADVAVDRLARTLDWA